MKRFFDKLSAISVQRSAISPQPARAEGSRPRAANSHLLAPCSWLLNSSPPGFTLFELLAAMGILAVLSALLFAAFNQGTKVWLQSENRVETYTQARAVLDFMANEISQAVTSSNVCFHGDATHFYFVAPLSASNRADLCEIGYVFDPTLRTLTRQFTAPTTLNIGGNWDININGSSWWNAFDLSAQVVLATSNIVNLTFAYLDQNLYPLPVANTTIFPNNTNLPYAIQITINVIDSRAAARLSVAGTSTNAIINESMRPFYRLVYIPTKRS
jgi:prepilin-type N-terminal cleavage/methylation domain-containing protein